MSQPRIDRPIKLMPGMVVRLKRDVLDVLTGEKEPRHKKTYKKGDLGVIVEVRRSAVWGLEVSILWRSDLENLSRRMGTVGGDGSLDYNDDYSIRMIETGIDVDNSGVMAIKLDDIEPVLDKEV